MKQTKRLIGMILSMALLLAPAMNMTVKATGSTPIPKIRITVGGDQKTPHYNAGEQKDLLIKVENQGTVAANNVTVMPNIENDENWPFEIENMNDEKNMGTIAAGESKEVVFPVKAKEKVATKSYKVMFTIRYDDGTNEETVQKSIYVNTTAKPEPEPQPQPAPAPQPEEPVGAGGEDLTGGSFSNSDPVAVGGGGGGSSSVPRVIVTGFRTEPGVVNAGSNFRLVVQVKNTSGSTAVSNMLFDLQAPTSGSDAAAEAPAFLPASGSSSIYLDRIPAGEVREIAIDLNARADLVQKPYSIQMSMKYEDANATQYEGASSLAVPISQAARFEFSEFEISPEAIAVGEEANITGSIYNTGRIKLYNVKVKFQGDGIKGKDIFIGNLDSGATGSIDGMLTGEKEMTKDKKCKMILSYEDESGAVSTVEQEFSLEVTALSADDMPMASEMEAPVSKGLPVIPIVAGVVIVTVAIIAFVVIKKKKKAQTEGEEDLLDELDRFTEDE